MAENKKKDGNPKKLKVLRNVGIISAIGAIITFILRIYFNSELDKVEGSNTLIVQIASKKMDRKECIDYVNEMISKCTTAAIVMLAIAVVLIALYVVMNKKKSDK